MLLHGDGSGNALLQPTGHYLRWQLGARTRTNAATPAQTKLSKLRRSLRGHTPNRSRDQMATTGDAPANDASRTSAPTTRPTGGRSKLHLFMKLPRHSHVAAGQEGPVTPLCVLTCARRYRKRCDHTGREGGGAQRDRPIPYELLRRFHNPI